MVWNDKTKTEYITNRRRKYKRKLIKLKGSKCQICGYNKCTEALEFHHKGQKDKKISLIYNRGWEKIIKEAENTLLVYANCHREIDYDLESGEAVNR